MPAYSSSKNENSAIPQKNTQQHNFFALWNKALLNALLLCSLLSFLFSLIIYGVSNIGFASLAFVVSLLMFFAGIYAYHIASKKKYINKALPLSYSANLDSSENNFRSLIESVSDAFVAIDKDWRCTYLNKKACEILNRDAESLLGKNIWEEFPDGINMPFYEAYHKAFDTQEFQRLEVYYPPMDKWFENRIYPSKAGITIFFKDVSEIKKITLALQQNEEKYRLLIERASDGIVIISVEGIILEVNDSIVAMMGYDKSALIGHHVSEFLNDEEIKTIPLRINELMQGKSFLYERNVLKKDGSFLMVEVNSKMASKHTLIGFVRDITERKKAEEAINKPTKMFELIAEATNDIIWDHDFVTNVTQGNKKLYNLYGINPGDMVINFETFISHIHPAEREGIRYRMKKAIESKASLVTELFHFKTTSGEYRIFYDRANIRYSNDGTPLRILGAMQDITDTENFKNQLIKEKELSDSIINSMPGIFYLFNSQGKYLRWNKNLENITGFTNEEIKNMNPIDFFIDEEKDLVAKKIANVFTNGADTVEAHFVLKNGEQIPYYFTGLAINYEGENCLLGMGLDFSDKQKAEKAILKSEEKYRVIVEHATDGIFMADNETRFIDVNTAGCRLLGYTHEELVGKKFTDLIPKEDKISNPVKLELLQKGESVINERRLLHKDGTLIEVEISAQLLPDGRYQSFIRDISERKRAAEKILQSEQKYKLMFDNNPLPMWMTTLPGLDIIDVNEAAIKQYGYSREEFLKLNTRQLRPVEDLEYFLAEVAKMQSDKINVRVWRHKRKDGSIIHVETYSHEIVYEGQRAWLGLSHDITEKTEAKELLQKSYNDIRELASSLQTIREDERTIIAREIHDELGQQLTGLKMDLHWLSKKINSHDVAIIKKMAESKLLINATIDSVRKIATDLRPSILDDLGLLAALEWQGEEFEKRSGTNVTFINNTGEIIVKPEIATAIFRIYQELLTNINRHARASEIKVELGIEKEHLIFNLQDNGVGFNTEEIKNKKTLGLLGIKERTLLLGGTYDFKSTLGKGSVTSISIPLGVKDNLQ
ncbi:MAG TPA: PAS domain S-box protein [Ferruginibacter sp.]|nr:PAS domain S-box protein [Ferruginibacter sp.]